MKNTLGKISLCLTIVTGSFSFAGSSLADAEDHPEAAAIIGEYNDAAAVISDQLDGIEEDSEAVDWVVGNLKVMFELDQLARRTSHRYADLDEEASEWFLGQIDTIIESMFTNHMSLYRELLEANGWFDISRFGSDADYHGWYFAQHDDMESEFREDILKILETKVVENETSPSGFANLTDIVALDKGERQIYGTLGSCGDEGKWEPEPIADESDLATLREEMELPDFDGFLEEMHRICSSI